MKLTGLSVAQGAKVETSALWLGRGLAHLPFSALPGHQHGGRASVRGWGAGARTAPRLPCRRGWPRRSPAAVAGSQDGLREQTGGGAGI